MKRNKLAKKLTAALLTGAMVMSMGGMTAFANQEVGQEGQVSSPVMPDTDNDSIEFSKVINKEKNVYTPNVGSIDFTVTPVTIPGGKVTEENGAVVYSGIKDAVTFATGADFAEAKDNYSTTPVSDTVTLAINRALFVDEDDNFQPGIYRYTVTEKETNYDGLMEDPTEYTLDVYVYSDASGKTCQSVLYSVKEGKREKVDKIVNNYETNNLTVKKIVDGDQANLGKEFPFTITITSTVVGEKYYYVNGTETGTLTTTNNGETISASKTFELGNNESVIIYGLSENDSYTVVENEVENGTTSDGYRVKYDNNGTVTEGSGADDGVTGAMGTAERDIVVTNLKNGATPAGIAMTFAPYAVMVAFAGVFAVMFLRKKREDF